MNMKSRRLAVIIALGVVLTVVWKLVVSYPYFALCVWTDDVIEGCEQNQNKDLLLRAVRSSVLPYSVRAEALCGLMRLRDRQELEFYLPNEEIDRLKQEFEKEENTFYDVFYQPFVNGEPNPRLVEIALDASANTADRFGAFLQLCEPKKLSEQQVTQIETVWKKIDSEQVRLSTMRAIIRCKRGGITATNLFSEITTEEGLTSACTVLLEGTPSSIQ
jgi:hypothetical protein